MNVVHKSNHLGSIVIYEGKCEIKINVDVALPTIAIVIFCLINPCFFFNVLVLNNVLLKKFSQSPSTCCSFNDFTLNKKIKALKYRGDEKRKKNY